ncbi:MAG: amylo-alpha-1,6-glucosidase [Oligoflexia bacterium]|nr:amylo-alpha-1,6-glucosidase [Oligoflexia bacterium]
MRKVDPACEWLETNRFGSFAMGSVDRIPRRKYHSLLTVREPGHGEALNVLVDIGEYLQFSGSEDRLYMLNAFDFGDRVEPKGFNHLVQFTSNPHPRWVYEIDGLRLERVVQLDSKTDTVRVLYAVKGVQKPLRLRLRPFAACRPIHALTRENPFLNGAVQNEGPGSSEVSFGFYDKLPRIRMRVRGANARFLSRGEWVRDVFHAAEKERGYPAHEDLYAPGEFEIELTQDATFAFEAGIGQLAEELPVGLPKDSSPRTLIGKLEAAGEKFLISTKGGFQSVIAGYPWFGHWGRDTFISLPGLCLETGDVKRASGILESYGELIVEALQTRGIVCDFPDKGLILTGLDVPLLYIRAVQLHAARATRTGFSGFMPIVCRILNGLRHGVDKRVRVTDDGGIYVQPGPWTTTWMDVLTNGQPVTPRAGFAVDINALFYNAVQFAVEWAKVNDAAFAAEWGPLAERAEQAFLERFWSDDYGYLADCVSGDSKAAGAWTDFSLRPNQLWAVALPYSPLNRSRSELVVAAVRKDLLTPVGLRTLSPSDPKYRGRYSGGPESRDAAYHQGTVWPWLLGIYADAVHKVDGVEKLKQELEPIFKRLAAHMEGEGCLGQLSEVFDGEAPHSPGGTPAQAWSVAEVLRAAYLQKL